VFVCILPGKAVPEMTYTVSGGTLNPTHSLTWPVGQVVLCVFAVRQKHYENVPDKMSEEEFWSRFFQSHYFHRDRVNFTNKDLFADCAKTDEQGIYSIFVVLLL